MRSSDTEVTGADQAGTGTGAPPPVAAPAPDRNGARPPAALVADPADTTGAEDLPEVVAQAEEITDDDSWLKGKLRDPRTIFSFLLALAILVFIFTRLDVHPAEIWATIKETNLALFGVAFLVYYSAFILRGLRWQTLLSNVGFTRARGYKMPSVIGLMEIIYLSWFVNCIVPAKLGDAYRSYLLKREAKISLSRTL